MSLAEFAAPLVAEGGRLLIKRLIRNKRAMFCPHCKQRVILPRKNRLNRRVKLRNG